MKKIKLCILNIILLAILWTPITIASSNDIFTVASEQEFDYCITNENICKLTDNLEISSVKNINGNVIIDLNGHSITPTSSLKLTSGFIYVNRGATLTINDAKGTGKISTGNSDNVWAAIQLIHDNNSNTPAELIVNGGTIEGYYYGITGNGNYHNSKITINGGTIKALNIDDSAAIYQPQQGELVINNGVISGGTGIEIRSGNLTVNNGEIIGAGKFLKVANKNGSTVNGAGISIAQHVTKNPINVKINNGNIKGQYGFYEWNPHNHTRDDLDKIKLQINGGNFDTTINEGRAVYSEDFTNFISGGKFNTNVDKYLTNDAKITSKELENSKKLEKENKQKNIIIPIIILITISGIGYYILIYKSKR